MAETRGNPLALLQLPRGLTASELARGFGLPDAQPPAEHAGASISYFDGGHLGLISDPAAVVRVVERAA